MAKDRTKETQEAAVVPVEENSQTLTVMSQTFNEAMQSEDVADVAEFGVYEQLSREQKQQLVGKPFIIESWESKPGDYTQVIDDEVYTTEFAIVRVLTEDNKRFVFTDGGVGILPFLRTIPKGKKLLCKKGLRRSEYETNVPGKGIVKGVTYYFA